MPCSNPALQLSHVREEASREAQSYEHDFGRVSEPGKANQRIEGSDGECMKEEPQSRLTQVEYHRMDFHIV